MMRTSTCMPILDTSCYENHTQWSDNVVHYHDATCICCGPTCEVSSRAPLQRSTHRGRVHRYVTVDLATPDNRLHQKLWDSMKRCLHEPHCEFESLHTRRKYYMAAEYSIPNQSSCYTLSDWPARSRTQISFRFIHVFWPEVNAHSHMLCRKLQRRWNKTWYTELFETHSTGIHISSKPK